MRAMRQIICIIMGAVIFSALGCKNTSAQEFSEEKVSEMLMSFYTSYINVNSISDSKTLDSLEKNFNASFIKTHPDGKGSDLIEKAYQNFIKENAALQRKKSDSIENKYLSSKLYNYLKHVNDKGLVLDYDPLLNSQMVDRKMLEHLTFRKDSKRNDVYYVSYTYGSNSPVTIKLSVVREKDAYKIDHVFTAGVDK